MKYLHNKFDPTSLSQASLFDELSLWSSHFGQVMLENMPMRKGMCVLDVGFGLGFPLLEIAQRMGEKSQIYGIDTWETAVQIARSKAKRLGLSNVRLHLGDAGEMPFDDKTFELIVSNVGINNFENAPKVLGECFRVLKKPGRICLTSNLQGHFIEFYRAYRLTIKELGLHHLLPELEAQERHRSTIESIRELLEDAGFSVLKVLRSKFIYRFVDGTAMLNHLLVRAGFLPGWRSFLPPEKENEIFSLLEKKLNKEAEWNGELRMDVPTVYVEALK